MPNKNESNNEDLLTIDDVIENKNVKTANSNENKGDSDFAAGERQYRGRVGRIEINKGFAAGITVGKLRITKNNISFIMRIRENTENQTGKKLNYFVAFTCYKNSELGEYIREKYEVNKLIYVEYYLDILKYRTSNEIFHQDNRRMITSVIFGDTLRYPNSRSVPFVNTGILTGEFVNIKNIPKSEDRAVVTILSSAQITPDYSSGRVYVTHNYLDLVVEGKKLISEIESRCQRGNFIGVEYKLDSNGNAGGNRNHRHGETIYTVSNLLQTYLRGSSVQ